MRAITTVLITFALTATTFGTATAGTTTSSSDTRRDTPGCVSKKEFKITPKGTRIRRAQRTYDTHGWGIDGGAGGFVKGYKFCKHARHQARTRKFTVVYNARGKHPRVSTKYCGPTLTKRRPCF